MQLVNFIDIPLRNIFNTLGRNNHCPFWARSSKPRINVTIADLPVVLKLCHALLQYRLQKGGVPATPSGTATLLRLSPSRWFYPK
jgi:hypothetical protein